MKHKIIVILGQTATGKSDLAVRLSQKFNGEVVSADSRQVYKGLDIGTGKITKKEMSGVPHHLLDVLRPQKRFTVAEYVELARKAIADIHARGKLPIISGGTGFYINALLGEIAIPNIPPNLKLRKRLGKKSTRELFEMLKKLDPRRATAIDKRNPVRLTRAIEIIKSKLNSDYSDVHSFRQMTDSDYDILKIGIKLPDATLKKKITMRLFARISRGLVAEAWRLHKQGLPWKRMEELGLEYRYLARFLQKKISKKEMLRKLKTEIWRYAKRQKTWFKRDERIEWFAPKQNKAILAEINKFLAI